MTTRREMLVVLGVGALAASFGAFAQQPSAKPARIGFLGATTASGRARQLDAFRAGLRDIGYIEGKNIVIEYRWADGKYDRLPELAADLVRLKVDVIVTHGTPGIQAAKAATAAIPIVMASSSEAVAMGLVGSLARPGGNVTGSTFFQAEYAGKWIELLKEAMPSITRAVTLINPNNAVSGPIIAATEIAAKTLKIGLQKYEARRADDFEHVFAAMAKGRGEVVVVQPDAMFLENAKVIASLAARFRMGAAGTKEFAEAGGLIGYSEDNYQLYRRAAYFVDRILKGAKPAELPVEQPMKFELVINGKTAKALGLTIPQSILVRADKVIE